jgi:hypothetical protein
MLSHGPFNRPSLRQPDSGGPTPRLKNSKPDNGILEVIRDPVRDE